jgi:cytochrome P450
MGIELNPLDHLKDLIRPVIYRYNTWRMNRYLNRVLETRYNSLMGKEYNPGKSVIDLALKAYLKENISAETIPAPFKAAALAQIKLFIFAGHDTTSSAVVFTFHLLSKHPQALKRMREEHNAVLGINERKALSVLMSNPHLLNQLPYTLAAIKEALRLYSTVAAIRDGQPDFSLVAQDGQIFPTEGCMVWGDHYANHHNPDIWPRAEEYLPERWLCKEGGPLYPPSNAWRPFERGPRNCIGQELTLTEIKIILALTIREFTIKDAYAEFDKAKRNVRNMTVNGTRAYMVRIGGGGHPADEYPCRVSMW